MAKMWGDPAVVAMISGVPDTPGEAWLRLLRHIGQWAVCGYGFWTVLDRESGAFLGQAGFFDKKREIAPEFNGMPEAGWGLVSAAQGRGLATEAMRAAMVWGDANLPGRETFALFDPGHAASIRVGEKLGYGRGKLYSWEDGEALIMRRGG